MGSSVFDSVDNATPLRVTRATSPVAAAEGYQEHIQLFRAVAITLVVCTHIVPSLDWTATPLLGRAIEGLAHHSSIYFVFIAGYLFQHLSNRFAYRSYLKRKLVTVIVPYCLLSIPALVIFTALVERTEVWPWFYELEVWQQVGLFLITGRHLAPLWFIPTIAILYVLAPALLVVDKNTRLYWVIPPLLILSTYLGREGPYGPINAAVYLLPVYLVGMACSRFKDASLGLVRRWWGLLALVAVASLVGFVADQDASTHYQMPMKLALALLMMAGLSNWRWGLETSLHWIAEVSFGIYFIHAYVISAIKIATVYVVHGRIYLGEGSNDLPGTPLVLLSYAIIVLALTAIIIRTAQRQFGPYSRMIVGA